jgi:hypothetical protein
MHPVLTLLNFTFRYIDDVLSLINSNFGKFVDHIYTIGLERKDNTYTYRSASYIDLHLEIDSEGRLRTNLYDKRDDFYFPIVNFSFICSKIPVAPAYGEHFPQSIRYSRACGSYLDFIVCNTITPTSRENRNHLFCRKGSFSTAPHCQFRDVGQCMKQTYMYMYYPFFQAQWYRYDQRNYQN